MAKVLVFLDKYSDWLETYSFFSKKAFTLGQVDIHIVDNPRNDLESTKDVYSFILSETPHNIIIHRDKDTLFSELKKEALTLVAGDYLIAPFVRYTHVWSLVNKVKKGVSTIHLSECLPDTFGPVKYRIAFKGSSLKSWVTLPLGALYAILHKPDVCYFPLFPQVKNPFVKDTEAVEIPPLLPAKKEIIDKLFNGEKRAMLVGGFGYDIEKMAKFLKLDKFVATSKGAEIIIDGISHPLQHRICAEEVLLSGNVHTIVGYNSSAMVWAKLLFPEMNIDCYLASAFDVQYGPGFNKLSVKALKALGVNVKPECKEMLVDIK